MTRFPRSKIRFAPHAPDRLSLAARHERTSDPHSWAHWLRRRPVEAAARLRNRGTRLLLLEARAEGLQYVEITTDPNNTASRHVIEANHGVVVEEFLRPQACGGTPALRYRIEL